MYAPYVYFFIRKPIRIAPVGQARTQSPQRMHSAELTFSVGSTPMRQAAAQAPQRTHLSASTLPRQSAKRLKTP